MAGPAKCALLFFAACALALPAAADEIRLKDGKKLHGNIVGYEDNMFRVKTEFGFVLVEKDKIASIIPSTPTGSPAPTEAKSEPQPETKPAAPKPKLDPATAAVKPVPKSAAPRKPEPAPTMASDAPAASTAMATTAVAASLGPPKAPEPPPSAEEVQGNQYINRTYGFRMYKAPGWDLIQGARQALPNAIVAMGTADENTLLVVGREPLNESLDASAAAIERRLEDVYENYRRLAQKETQVAGLPAVEVRYRGIAGGHDWSGRLVTIARGSEVFTILAMTYADSDLIQIQENVISHAIASLDFSPQ
jgi:hypothetical protein